MRKEVAEHLVAAGAYLAAAKFGKGADVAERDECCVVLAVERVPGPYGETEMALVKAVGGGLKGLTSVFEWNDRPETAQEDAVQLLVTTAEKVRTGEIKLEGVS